MARDYNKYKHTRAGLTSAFHTNSKSCKGGEVTAAGYSLDELRTWLDTQPVFIRLFNAWVRSEHLQELKPCLIRVDLNEPHTLSNIKVGLRSEVRKSTDKPKTGHDSDWFLWHRVICKPWEIGAVL